MHASKRMNAAKAPPLLRSPIPNPSSPCRFNKGIELATESIPGCVLQMYVWLTNPAESGTYALASIAISALTTGFASATISFDKDIDVHGRKNQPQYYGYLPDDNGIRGRCFLIMNLTGTLHNLSRSAGCAILLASKDSSLLALYLIGGELSFYLISKVLRGDFYYFASPATAGPLAFVSSMAARVAVKLVVDFSGCLHFRHPFELGGFAFSLSMVWAQIFPFVALQFYEGEDFSSIATFLVCSLISWLLLNVAFFCTINLKVRK